MNKQLIQLAQRREALVLRTAAQRAQLAQIADVWREPLAMADKAFTAISFIKKHPIIMTSVGAILLKVIRPSRLGKWFSRGVFLRSLIALVSAPHK